jgi:hypothetical protein
VGTVFIKRTDTANNWYVHHRSVGGTQHLILDNTGAATSYGGTELTTSTTSITINMANNITNASGGTYVAYVFAHNDGDGEFGPDGDQDIIKCGSYTGNGSTDGPEVDLGFEPQFVIVKGADVSRGWVIGDIMRGAPVGSNGQRLFANTSDAETAEDTVFAPTSTGFKIRGNSGTVNDSGLDYIYMAIRRGPLAQPESGTEVFAPVAYTGTGSARTTATGGT